jgi:hypothetical protein
VQLRKSHQHIVYRRAEVCFRRAATFFDVGGTPVRLTRKCGADMAFGASQQETMNQ